MSENQLGVLTEGQGTWRIFKVSALHDLQYNLTRLKQYSTKIKQALSSAVIEKVPVKYRVSIDVDPDLKKNPQDPHAILIKVYTRAVSGAGAEVLSYSAVLMSWGEWSEVPRATHLPLMLEKGRAQVAATVNMTIIKMFDCTITPFYFTKSHMLLFGLLFCQMEPLETSRGVKFCFKIPQATTKNKITLTVNIGDFLGICDRVAAEEDEGITQQQLVELTYVALQRHVFTTVYCDISVLELVEVSHPMANIKTSGALRIRSTNIKSAVLDILNGLLVK